MLSVLSLAYLEVGTVNLCVSSRTKATLEITLFNCGWDAVDSKKWEGPTEIRAQASAAYCPKATVQPSLSRDPQIQVSQP